MRKTKFDSFSLRDFDVLENKRFSARQKSGGFLSVAEGCKYCVKGQKLVLFITGKCSRNCKYCSLSLKRKNKDIIWANERECKNIKEVIEEAKASKAFGAGMTGGDPLICLARTIRYVKALKKEFGKKFHVHIYLPTELVTEEKLKKLKNAGIDEIRFHPKFLENEKVIEQVLEKQGFSGHPKLSILAELEKIALASKFWPRYSIGIEIPIFPGKINETFYFIKSSAELIGFVNLNELEISDTNFDFIKSKYKINEDTYTIKGSKEAGLEILKRCEKEKLKIKVHLCTARTKNLFQYKNRLKLRKILPFGYRTEDGSVRYFVIYLKDLKKKEISNIKKFKNYIYLDKKKKRFILSEKIIKKILQFRYKIYRIEELPTFDRTELEKEEI
jgi:uncharacterized protein